jgi:DNA-binding transcriptional ArsR family regulator
MEAVFQALAHRDRRRILDIVKGAPGCCVNDVCSHFDVSRIAVMKHLGVLEAAQLIVSEKKGRQRRLYHNAAPIQMIYDRWTSAYSKLWASRLTQVKYAVENKDDAHADETGGNANTHGGRPNESNRMPPPGRRPKRRSAESRRRSGKSGRVSRGDG